MKGVAKGIAMLVAAAALIVMASKKLSMGPEALDRIQGTFIVPVVLLTISGLLARFNWRTVSATVLCAAVGVLVVGAWNQFLLMSLTTREVALLWIISAAGAAVGLGIAVWLLGRMLAGDEHGDGRVVLLSLWFIALASFMHRADGIGRANEAAWTVPFIWGGGILCVLALGLRRMWRVKPAPVATALSDAGL